MSYISMSGHGSVGELCENLENWLDKKFGMLTMCQLLESTRRNASGAETAVLLFMNSSIMSRYAESFAVSLCADEDVIIADVLTRSTQLFSDGDKIALKVAETLREHGFVEYERESWVLEADKRAAEPEPASLYGLYSGYLCPYSRKPQPRAEQPAESKPEQRRGKKHSYDPEI